MNIADWPSLTDQRDVAADLYGHDRGNRLVTEWLHDQTAKVDSTEFARQFSDHIALPGVVPADYAHRMISCRAGNLLGGIRFYRRNLDRPFVEVIGHSFTDLEALRDCVRTEWSMFRPLDLRLRIRPDTLTGPHLRLDVSIHAAPYAHMTPPDGRVVLRPFAHVDDAIALVQKRFEHMRETQPDLYANVSPAEPDDILDWHTAGQLRAIVADNHVVGLLAITPGAVDWIHGEEVREEIVDAAFVGRGYAASAQSAWAHTMAHDRSVRLVGTIDHLNLASRKSAQRAGRPHVLDDVFVSLN
ncbi:GNAT family N-acetyltransferase [Mycolicibacterium sp. lyk4-40-TYG-92]|uniref:GNAT family N-acetyltransferase n=1 Tax=Mycolicibacterium sp. lyk4-40-TYG-92 TaxID=3040295 RepID=UPI0025516E29|nr:GNAT family N-acetyltransferase [Mycolicibacterium sp. lyk4-40-TYG-92]